MKREDELFEAAIKAYGMTAQLDVLQEECAELICAVHAVKRNKKGHMEMIIDELADVKIMVDQIVFAMNIKNAVYSREQFKLSRLADRISQHKFMTLKSQYLNIDLQTLKSWDDSKA